MILMLQSKKTSVFSCKYCKATFHKTCIKRDWVHSTPQSCVATCHNILIAHAQCADAPTVKIGI